VDQVDQARKRKRNRANHLAKIVSSLGYIRVMYPREEKVFL
jgi:hypothetical protein